MVDIGVIPLIRFPIDLSYIAGMFSLPIPGKRTKPMLSIIKRAKKAACAALLAGATFMAMGAVPAKATAYYLYVFSWQNTNPGNASTTWVPFYNFIGPISGTTLTQCQSDASAMQTQLVTTDFLVSLVFCVPIT